MKKQVTIKQLEARIKRKLKRHLLQLGFQRDDHGLLSVPDTEKLSIRGLHRKQRGDKLRSERPFIKQHASDLIQYFASGSEIDPRNIEPRLQLVLPGTFEANLFRFASLTWSVPVSDGYGRRLRFLVWDNYNGKLMGIIALGDPVFNLRVRDQLIGWTSKDRMSRLVNILDAYVLGALPPYNMLIGGKLLTCLIRTKEMKRYFGKKYGDTRGIISGKKKKAALVAVTTSSSLGRSAIYNRLKLNQIEYFKSIGFTEGWGHFHVPDDLFEDMRALLQRKKHSYADDHKFGGGPNWKMRAIRATLDLIGLNPDLLRHGIYREVFICRLAHNAESYLLGKSKKPRFSGLLSVKEVSQLAIERWIAPRAERRPEYAQWKSKQILDLLDPDKDSSASLTKPENDLFSKNLPLEKQNTESVIVPDSNTTSSIEQRV